MGVQRNRVQLHRAERAGATRTQRELAERLAVEEQRLQRLGRDAVHSPAVGLVWNLAVADEARVARGDTLAEIAQCGRSFVEATLPERGFDVVRPGDAVRVRLSSGTGDIPGMVRSVRGAGAIGASGRAAGVQRGETGMMWVVVDIDAAALSKQPAGDCQIGRTAKVLFSRAAKLAGRPFAPGLRGRRSGRGGSGCAGSARRRLWSRPPS